MTTSAQPDDGPGSDRGPFPDQGSKEAKLLLASGGAVVGKRRVGADENPVAEADAVPKIDAAFDGDPVADHDVVFNENVGVDVATAPDLRSRKDMGKFPNLRVGSDFIGFDHRPRIDENSFRHAQS